jgi:hypothetical protein
MHGFLVLLVWVFFFLSAADCDDVFFARLCIASACQSSYCEFLLLIGYVHHMHVSGYYQPLAGLYNTIDSCLQCPVGTQVGWEGVGTFVTQHRLVSGFSLSSFWLSHIRQACTLVLTPHFA